MTSQTNPLSSLAGAPSARFTMQPSSLTEISLHSPSYLYTRSGWRQACTPGRCTGCAMHRVPARPEDSPIAGHQLLLHAVPARPPDSHRRRLQAASSRCTGPTSDVSPTHVELALYRPASFCPSMPTHRASTYRHSHAAVLAKSLFASIV